MEVKRLLPSARFRGRPRCEDTSEHIRAATLALLEEGGYEALTLEAVAARAGVGKPTIYRWWKGKPGLVADVLLRRLAPIASFPTTGVLLSDLTEQMRGVAKAFSGSEGRWLASLVVASQCDAGTAEQVRQSFLQPRRAQAAAILQAAVERGELRNVSIETLIDALYAPFYHRLLMGHAPLDGVFVDQLIDTVMNGVLR